MTAHPVILNRRVDPSVLSTVVDAGSDDANSTMDESRDDDMQHFCVLTREDGSLEVKFWISILNFLI